mgnify:FL=1
MKTCSKCGAEKPLNEFYKKKASKDGRQLWCKECAKDYQVNHLPENTYWNKRKLGWLRRGITDVDTVCWFELIESQSGLCYVCRKSIDPKSAVRDHDHDTGLTRAAVCSLTCNQIMDLIADGVLCRVDP